MAKVTTALTDTHTLQEELYLRFGELEAFFFSQRKRCFNLGKKKAKSCSGRGKKLCCGPTEHQEQSLKGGVLSLLQAPKGHPLKGTKNACFTGTPLGVCLESLGNLKIKTIPKP